MNYITFDIETYSPSGLKKIDTNEFRVSVIGAYLSWLGKYVAFMESDVRDFLDILKEVDLVVGYNHLWFDLPVLQKYANFDLLKLTSYDIMLEFEKKAGFKCKLDDLAKSNLGAKKTDTYEHYSKYHLEGKWFELVNYCMHDVRLTEQLFRMSRLGQAIKLTDALETKEFILDIPRGKKILLEAMPESIF